MLHTCAFPRHSPYPEDNFPVGMSEWWLHFRPYVLASLQKGKHSRQSYYGPYTDNLLIYPSETYLMEHKMNGRKSKDNAGKRSSEPIQPLPLEWVNAPFTSEDYDILEQDTTQLELLSAMLIGLVVRGYGVSVKFNFERKSYSCTIYRSPCDGNRRNLGLSGNAPDVRDSILSALYRLESKCGGNLDDSSPTTTSNQHGRRFG